MVGGYLLSCKAPTSRDNGHLSLLICDSSSVSSDLTEPVRSSYMPVHLRTCKNYISNIPSSPFLSTVEWNDLSRRWKSRFRRWTDLPEGLQSTFSVVLTQLFFFRTSCRNHQPDLATASTPLEHSTEPNNLFCKINCLVTITFIGVLLWKSLRNWYCSGCCTEV